MLSQHLLPMLHTTQNVLTILGLGCLVPPRLATQTDRVDQTERTDSKNIEDIFFMDRFFMDKFFRDRFFRDRFFRDKFYRDRFFMARSFEERSNRQKQLC